MMMMHHGVFYRMSTLFWEADKDRCWCCDKAIGGPTLFGVEEVLSSIGVKFAKVLCILLLAGGEEEEIEILPPPADDASPLKVFAALKSLGDVGLCC